MFLIVPLGLLHIDLSPNSLTLASSDKQKVKSNHIRPCKENADLTNELLSNFTLVRFYPEITLGLGKEIF